MNLEEKLHMIGIDHTRAGIEIREQFAMTGNQISELLEKIKAEKAFSGAIVLSTCNRLELYVSFRTPQDRSLLSRFEELSGRAIAGKESCFYEKSGQELVRYLFRLASGLESKIVGEDQILTQIGDALTRSRTEFASDRTLEVLFREAITCAKQIKTNIRIAKNNSSAAAVALLRLQEMGYRFDGKKALVIGNGMMGKLAAQALIDAGADVTVTVRQYRSGVVDVPPQARRIGYKDRYEEIEDSDYIFSATASPNLTIRKESLQAHCKSGQIFVDLAVPRDIETEIGTLDGIRLYDIDDFGIEELSEEMKLGIRQADTLIDAGVQKYMDAYESLDLIPVVQQVAKDAAADLWGRTNYRIRQKLKLDERQQAVIEQSAKESGEKVVSHLLFSLRDELDTDTFRQLLEILGRR